LGQPGGLP